MHSRLSVSMSSSLLPISFWCPCMRNFTRISIMMLDCTHKCWHFVNDKMCVTDQSLRNETIQRQTVPAPFWGLYPLFVVWYFELYDRLKYTISIVIPFSLLTWVNLCPSWTLQAVAAAYRWRSCGCLYLTRIYIQTLVKQVPGASPLVHLHNFPTRITVFHLNRISTLWSTFRCVG